MRLTQFAKVVRTLRMTYDRSLREMAQAMHMGPSYLSALEYGERKLTSEHIERAVAYFRPFATESEIAELRRSGAESTEVLKTSALDPDSRRWVAAFARRLQEGRSMPKEVADFLETTPGDDPSM